MSKVKPVKVKDLIQLFSGLQKVAITKPNYCESADEIIFTGDINGVREQRIMWNEDVVYVTFEDEMAKPTIIICVENKKPYFQCRFCKHTYEIVECYDHNGECLLSRFSLNNLKYRLFITPISNVANVVKYRFLKCDSLNNNCSFRAFKKYCTLGHCAAGRKVGDKK